MRPRHGNRRRPGVLWRATVGVTAVAALACVLWAPLSAAASGSIAFINENNVWVITPDGSRLRQVTTDGTSSTSYGSPSQADDGTILARHGQVFVRLRPDGTKLGAPIPACRR